MKKAYISFKGKDEFAIAMWEAVIQFQESINKFGKKRLKQLKKAIHDNRKRKS